MRPLASFVDWAAIFFLNRKYAKLFSNTLINNVEEQLFNAMCFGVYN